LTELWDQAWGLHQWAGGAGLTVVAEVHLVAWVRDFCLARRFFTGMVISPLRTSAPMP
jgi:hypothetical protein